MTQKELKKIALEVSELVFDVNKTNNFSNDPFPHFYIDNFFNKNFLNKIISSFPPINSKDLSDRGILLSSFSLRSISSIWGNLASDTRFSSA